MQKLIRAMRIAFGAEHAADHHLRLGEALAQHAHQRNRAALADVATGRAKVRLAGSVECILKPRHGRRRVPAVGAAGALPGHLGLVGRVVFEQRLHLLHTLRGIDQRRQAQ